MLPIIASICFLVAPGTDGATSETSVRARATAVRALDAPRGEIISEAPSPTAARSLGELMRVRIVLPDGIVSESARASAAMGPREMHASIVGDLGAAIP